MPPLLQLYKITVERGWRVGGKKVSLRRFLADQKIASSWEGWGGAFWGIL